MKDLLDLYTNNLDNLRAACGSSSAELDQLLNESKHHEEITKAIRKNAENGYKKRYGQTKKGRYKTR